MHRLDSFLRESQRMNGIGFGMPAFIVPVAVTKDEYRYLAHIFRKMFTDLTFSNGITLPAGTYITAPINAIHYDDKHYQDTEVFNPWRFYDLREVSDGPNKYQYVTPSAEYLAFGYGKHAWYVTLPKVSDIHLVTV